MDEASETCIDERESYVIMFTEGLNGYVCRNEGAVSERRALFRGTYRDCQIWVERRGIAAALRVVSRSLNTVAELGETQTAGQNLLQLLAKNQPG